MKVFLSWSGETSHKVALAFRDWLPKVIQVVEPYVSSEDIDKGQRWSVDIACELDSSNFGILCVTPDNIQAPWLLFEAGALGKSVDKSKVCPFLFNLNHSDISGPLLQFQSTLNRKNDVFKLLLSMLESCTDSKITEISLEEIFDVWWPKLEDKFSDIQNDINLSPLKEATSTDQDDKILEILNEVLEISRTNQKLLRDPDTFFSESNINHLVKKYNFPKQTNLVKLFSENIKWTKGSNFNPKMFLKSFESLMGHCSLYVVDEKSFDDKLYPYLMGLRSLLKSLLPFILENNYFEDDERDSMASAISEFDNLINKITAKHMDEIEHKS